MSKSPRFKSVVEKHFGVLRPIEVPSDSSGVVELDRGKEFSTAEVHAHFRRQRITIRYREPAMNHPKEEARHAKTKAKKPRS